MNYLKAFISSNLRFNYAGINIQNLAIGIFSRESIFPQIFKFNAFSDFFSYRKPSNPPEDETMEGATPKPKQIGKTGTPNGRNENL